MPPNDTSDDIEADFEILEAIGVQVGGMIDTLLATGVINKTLRRWLVGHADMPDGEDAQTGLMAMAGDLEMFTPSPSGRTMVDRRLQAVAPTTSAERQAVKALGAAQFRLVRIVDRDGPDLVRLKDLVTGETLVLLDARISAMAIGLPTAMRLSPLASGRYVVTSPLFAMDETLLAEAMAFVRNGRPLGHGHRCAAALYRNVARRGFQPLPRLDEELDEQTFADFVQALEDHLSPIQCLALRWLEGADADPDLVVDTRQLASVENLVDTLGHFAEIAGDGSDGAPEGLKEAFAQMAAVLVDTMAGRARAGVQGAAEMLDSVATEINGYIAQGKMEPGARALFDRLTLRSAFSSAKNPPEGAASKADEIDRVIQRIQALRAKTADRGCTEAEAMAAAAKVSELLARHDLTLDEVSVRQSACEGVSIATGRKRRAPVDSCTSSIAAFCDCRVWSETAADGGLNFVFFGLKADVEAARFLHELIEDTFDTESTTFRDNPIYQSLSGGDRRTALNSFQIGLARGITVKLDDLKADRQDSGAQSTGFDLVAVKQSMLDDEIARLGLHFTTRAAASRRRVHSDAYHAGRVAGALFEPAIALGN